MNTKMTYFRMPSDMRNIMDMERAIDKSSYQTKVSAILREHFQPKLHLYNLCVIAANRYKVDKKELYIAAITAEHSGNLSHLIPQISSDLPVIEALDNVLKKIGDVAWVQVNPFGTPEIIHLTQPATHIDALECKIK